MRRATAVRPLLGPALGLALLSGAAAASAEAPRAAGGVRLVEALESATIAVAGTVLDTRHLDRHGWAGTLSVDSPLSSGVALGTELPIAWEERSPSRRPRFAPGERILVALEPLPGDSIWRSRIPDAKTRSATLAPAQSGDAFLRRPSSGALLVLQHYLALSAAGRADSPGAGYLAELAARAELPLALSAVARLRGHAELDDHLGQGSARLLVQALLRDDASTELNEAIVNLVGSRHLESLRGPLESAATRDGLAPPAVYAALAQLDDGLSAQRTERLLERDGPHREVAARFAAGPDAGSRLARLIREDRDPAVRSAAIERLVELDGPAAVPGIAAGLYDPERSVRLAAAQGLGSLGAAAVPELEDVALGTRREAAQAAVTGLVLTQSPEGREALLRIAEEHPDEGIRTLAGIALGGPIGEAH